MNLWCQFNSISMYKKCTLNLHWSVIYVHCSHIAPHTCMFDKMISTSLVWFCKQHSCTLVIPSRYTFREEMTDRHWWKSKYYFCCSLGQAIPKCDIKLVYGIPSLHSWYLGFQQSFKNKLFYKKSGGRIWSESGSPKIKIWCPPS
jgi:hypothetical protein